MLSRRAFFLGALAAPAVIRIPGLLMPVKTPIITNPMAIPPGMYTMRILDVEGVFKDGSFAISYAVVGLPNVALKMNLHPQQFTTLETDFIADNEIVIDSVPDDFPISFRS